MSTRDGELQPGRITSPGLDGLFDTIAHPLRHLRCPECGIRFGLEHTEVMFAEQTSIHLWCPRGHRLRIVTKTTGDPT